VLATVPSHARLTDRPTPPSPPASHRNPPPPSLPRSPTTPWVKRHATPAPSSMMARIVASREPIAVGGAGAGAAVVRRRRHMNTPSAGGPCSLSYSSQRRPARIPLQLRSFRPCHRRGTPAAAPSPPLHSDGRVCLQHAGLFLSAVGDRHIGQVRGGRGDRDDGP